MVGRRRCGSISCRPWWRNEPNQPPNSEKKISGSNIRKFEGTTNRGRRLIARKRFSRGEQRMKLGLGLYRHMLTPENFRFARQAGATHIVAHWVDYFREGPRIPQSESAGHGWGVTQNQDELWTVEELTDLRQAVEAEGLTPGRDREPRPVPLARRAARRPAQAASSSRTSRRSCATWARPASRCLATTSASPGSGGTSSARGRAAARSRSASRPRPDRRRRRSPTARSGT